MFESSFCSSINYNNFCQNLTNVISENTAAFSTYNASAWQADSIKHSLCLQLQVEGACRYAHCTEGDRLSYSPFYSTVSTIITLYWCRFTIRNFLILYHPVFTQTSCFKISWKLVWLVCYKKTKHCGTFQSIFHRH